MENLEDLKFRAKITPNDNWIYGYPVKLENGWGFLEYGKYCEGIKKVEDPSFISQYILMRDKSGEPIYTKDIVKATVKYIECKNPTKNDIQTLNIIAEIGWDGYIPYFKLIDISLLNNWFKIGGRYNLNELKDIEIIKEYTPNSFLSEKELLILEIDRLKEEKNIIKEEIEEIKDMNKNKTIFSFKRIFKI